MSHMTAAYTAMQNGTVKKANRTIGDAVKALLTGGGMVAKHRVEAACSFVQTRNAIARNCFSGKSAWEVFTGQSPPSLHDFFFGQKILYWQPRVKREKWEVPGVEARFLSKAVHLTHNSHPGGFRVWDEEKQDVVLAADIKPLSILPDVDSFLLGQQSHRRGRQREDGDHVLQFPYKILADAEGGVQGPWVPCKKMCRNVLRNCGGEDQKGF